MACSCQSGSSTRPRRRPTAARGTTPASGIGWRGSEDAPSWSRRPSVWWTSASPCSPALLETTGSPTSYLCSPKTLHIQQHGSHFQGQRLAAGGCVGEVQAAALAQVALLGAHQPVLDVLFAPAALASKSHSQSPWRSSSTRKIGHLCRSQALRDVTLAEDASRIRINPGIMARLRSY